MNKDVFGRKRRGVLTQNQYWCSSLHFYRFFYITLPRGIEQFLDVSYSKGFTVTVYNLNVEMGLL